MVAVITAGLLLLVAGEAEFHLVGFVLVMMAAALAGLRWTITQALLQGKGHVLSHSERSGACLRGAPGRPPASPASPKAATAAARRAKPNAAPRKPS